MALTHEAGLISAVSVLLHCSFLSGFVCRCLAEMMALLSGAQFHMSSRKFDALFKALRACLHRTVIAACTEPLPCSPLSLMMCWVLWLWQRLDASLGR